MVRERKFGMMGPNMKENGAMAWLKEMELLIMPMVMFIVVNFTMIVPMGLANLSI